MKTEPCSCCADGKTSPKHSSQGRRYNKVKGNSAKWAKHNNEPRSEFTVPVKDGKRFGGPQWQKDACGDGTFGFPTRRKGHDEANMERGLDGQWKNKRSTLVKRKSARSVSSRHAKQVWGGRCLTWSSDDLARVQRDPLAMAQQNQLKKKISRRENRNRAAALGHKVALMRGGR
jgi:hypothetical protein